MKRLLLVCLVVTAVVFLFVSCGSSSKSESVVPPQPNAVAFLQQKPGTDLFYPVLGNFSGTQFTTSMIKDPSTGNYVSAAIGSIILSAKGDKATLEVYGGTNNALPSYQWDIYVGTIDGANLVQVTNDAYPDEVPQFNPAGTKVIFSSYRPGTESSNWVTVVRNVDGTGEQVLPQPVGAQDSWHASYSPDGSKIAVEAASEIANPPFYGIVMMNADGSNAAMLTNPYSADCYCADEDPYFTSDGTHIVFSREDYAVGTEDVYVMKTDGTAITKLTDGTGLNFDPMIVRDTTTKADRILFSSNRDNVNAGNSGFELYTMKTDGTGLTRLTNNSVYDGFNQEFYEMSSGSLSRAARPQRRLPRTPAPPAQRLQW
jgi:hypothetical protein